MVWKSWARVQVPGRHICMGYKRDYLGFVRFRGKYNYASSSSTRQRGGSGENKHAPSLRTMLARISRTPLRGNDPRVRQGALGRTWWGLMM